MNGEALLLQLCARVELDAAQRAAARRLLESDIDWVKLEALAGRHGLVPLLHGHLGAIAPPSPPKEVFASLWARHRCAARRNEDMAAELVSILRLFDAHGIAAIPYKGPTLAMWVYGDLGLREFGDLDILLRPHDVSPAKELLISRGYVPEYQLAPHLEALLVHSSRHYEMPLRDAARDFLVELHWRTDPDFPVANLDDEAWWRSLPTIALPGHDVRMLPNRELLLVLCLHGTKHFWGSLGWLVDVAELIRKDPHLDWSWILARAEELGCTRKLALGLHLARELLQAPMPIAVEEILRDRAVREIGDSIIPTLFSSDDHAWGLAAWLRMNLKLQQDPRRYLGHLLAVLFTPGLGEWQRWPLPRPLSFLYVPLRIGRLIDKYLIRPFQNA